MAASKTVPLFTCAGPVQLPMDMAATSAITTAAGPRQHQFSPYEMNGGTAVGLAGDDFCVIAADTRLSSGYSILSRNISRATKLSSRCVIATGGCRTDVITLHKVLTIRMIQYKTNHKREMFCPSTAQMLSNTLYYKRFMPYYAFNVLGGIDNEGKGAVYTYDAIGSFERVQYAAQGAGQKLIIPVLDNIVGYKNRTEPKPKLTLKAAVETIKDVFVTAGERDIYTGDSVEIFTITKDGVERTTFDLKRD